jgi:hypothetical protein
VAAALSLMPPLALTNGEVLIVVCLVALPVAAIAFAGAGAVLRQIGKGQFSIEQDFPQKEGGAGESKAVREAEIRQLLEGKAYRQQSRGETPLDVDAEVAKLLGAGPGPAALDPKLRQEVREHVIASNERRERKGQAPLDVEEEVERRLGEHSESPSRSQDKALREEIRQLVVARNERRMRRGEPPLDVKTEIDRQLRELESLGQ